MSSEKIRISLESHRNQLLFARSQQTSGLALVPGEEDTYGWTSQGLRLRSAETGIVKKWPLLFRLAAETAFQTSSHRLGVNETWTVAVTAP